MLQIPAMPLEVFRNDGKLPCDENFDFGLDVMEEGCIYSFVNISVVPIWTRYTGP